MVFLLSPLGPVSSVLTYSINKKTKSVKPFMQKEKRPLRGILSGRSGERDSGVVRFYGRAGAFPDIRFLNFKMLNWYPGQLLSAKAQ